jgi:hypothetical protein
MCTISKGNIVEPFTTLKTYGADKDKIILNKPVAGDGKYGGNMAV